MTAKKRKKSKVMDWYQGPLTKKRVAELRRKLAQTRGFLYQLQFALRGVPEFINLSTKDGEIDLSVKYLEKLLKETSDP